MSMVVPTLEDQSPVPQRPAFTLSDVAASVQRMNAPAQAGSTTFNAALLLQAASHLGQNVDRLARFTGISREVVARSARRLVDNGVWSGGKTVSSWIDDPEALDDFWADVAVAEGKLCRRVGEDGALEWAPQGYWRKHYEYVGPRGASPDAVCYHEHVDPIDQDYPYTIGEEDVAPAAAEAPAEHDGWLVPPPPLEPSPEPVWLGQSDEPAVQEVPAAVGGGMLVMFPEAVWLG